MKAVFRHELSSYFTGLTGYVFGAFLLLFTGIYTVAYNISSAVANFEYALGNMTFVFLIIVPILTMRVLAEEKRQKTDQLLYSLPLTMPQVVLGKYCALLIMLLIPTLIIGMYPVILSSFGNVHLPAAYSALLGFFLLGAALLAIGMFISSVTESQPVAAGLCFVVMLLNYFLTSLAEFVPTTAFASYAAFAVLLLVVCGILYLMTKNSFLSLLLCAVSEAALLVFYIVSASSFENLFPELITKLSLFEQFYVFVDGVFDLTAIVYMLSVSALFLYLSVQSLEKRRWSE